MDDRRDEDRSLPLPSRESRSITSICTISEGHAIGAIRKCLWWRTHDQFQSSRAMTGHGCQLTDRKTSIERLYAGIHLFPLYDARYISACRCASDWGGVMLDDSFDPRLLLNLDPMRLHKGHGGGRALEWTNQIRAGSDGRRNEPTAHHKNPQRPSENDRWDTSVGWRPARSLLP